MLKTILALLKKPSPTSAELEAALVQIDPLPLEEQVEKLESQRRGLLLKDDAAKAIEDLESKIREANLDLERLAVAKSELQTRIELAKRDEQRASVERAGAESHEAAEEGKRAYIELDQVMVDKVLPLLVRIKELEERQRAATKFTAENGRPDLKVLPPISQLADHLGFHPQSFPTIALWSMHGYWPAASAVNDRRRLNRMKEILR